MFKVNEAQDPNEMSETDKRRNSNLKIDRSNGKNSTFFGYFYKVMALSTKRGEIIQCNPDFYLQYDAIQLGTFTFHISGSLGLEFGEFLSNRVKSYDNAMAKTTWNSQGNSVLEPRHHK